MTDDGSEKRRVGRPRKAAGELRTDSLPAVRVTAAERAHVEDMAARAGLPLSEFCRRAALGIRVAERRGRADDAALATLNRAAANLYQIARALNFGQSLPPDMADTMDEVKAAVALILEDGP